MFVKLRMSLCHCRQTLADLEKLLEKLKQQQQASAANTAELVGRRSDKEGC